MRKTQNVMDSKMQQAHDWLQDPQALHGGVGEKSVRQVRYYRKVNAKLSYFYFNLLSVFHYHLFCFVVPDT